MVQRTGHFNDPGAGLYGAYLRPSASAPVSSIGIIRSSLFSPEGKSISVPVRAEDASCSRFSIRVLNSSGTAVMSPHVWGSLPNSTSFHPQIIDTSALAPGEYRLQLEGGTNCDGSGYGAIFDNITMIDP